MTPIRVLIVDDQALFREALGILLSAQPNLLIVGEAANGAQALDMVTHVQPDVILMDLLMPIMDGVAATRILKERRIKAGIIVLTTFDDDEYVFEALRAGAVGYLLKDASAQKLVEAITATAQGESFLQPSIAAKLVAEFVRQTAVSVEQPLTESLTPRELDTLLLMARGYSNREIAETLFVTEGTVKNHVTAILGKLEVRDRTQAVLKAKTLRLV
jgi:DNA-binding NarL/FixJ family response regulator